MHNKDLRAEFRIANVRQWEVAEAMGISEMTFVKWLRRELSEEKKKEKSCPGSHRKSYERQNGIMVVL